MKKRSLLGSVFTLLMVAVFALTNGLWFSPPTVQAEEPASWTPNGLKVNVVGASAAEEQFKFELSCIDGRKLHASNDAAGNIQFEGLTFTAEEVGEFEVRVKQVEGTDPRIRFDNKVLTYKLKVTAEGSGVTITKTEGPDSYTFSNEEIKECVWRPQAMVRFKDGKLPIEPNQYTVYLESVTDIQGSDRYHVATSCADADGTVNFDPFTYSVNEVGKPEYYLMTFATEELNSPISLSDETEYIFKVDPQLNGEKVEVSVTMYERGSNAPLAETVPIFELDYQSEGSTEIQVPVYIYNGLMPSDEFTFKLYEGEDTTGTLLANGFCFATDFYSGSVYFMADDSRFQLHFTQDDILDASGKPKVHKYCVVQTVGTDPDITYDTDKVVVHITLADNGKGTIFPEITFPGKSCFENKINVTQACIAHR